MKLFLAGVAVAGLVASATLAQDAPPPPSHEMHRPEMKPITKAEMQAMVAQHFAALDLNHDGKLTKEEVEGARRAMFDKMRKEHRDREFARLDSNHDGVISKAEFDVPPMPGPGGHDGPPPPPPGGPGMRMGPMEHGPMMLMGGHWFERADANHDGVVTLAEAQTAAAALFDKLDTNHDGTISPDEMRAAWSMHGGDHGMGGRHGRGGPGGPGGMPPMERGPGYDRPAGAPPPPQGE